MKRRGFLGFLGKASAAVVMAPIAAKVIAAIPEPVAALPVPVRNSSLKWYQSYDSFSPPTAADVLDVAEYNWKDLGGYVSIGTVRGDYSL